MRVITSLIAALAFVVSGAAADQAPKPVKKSFQTSWFPPEAAGAETVAWVAEGMSFEGNFHVWYLLGEPVINCTARWTNGANAQVMIKSGDGQVLIERAQEGEVEVYNLVLASTAPDPRYSGGDESQIAVFCDAGVVAQNGRDGFNVAGSPSWDRFICAVDRGYKDIRLRFTDDDLCKAVGGNWLDAAAAKSVAIKGLDSRKVGLWNGEVKALKAEVSGMPVMKRVEKRLWREKSAAFKRERARAYYSNFPARSGESTAEWSARKNDAMRRLPHLPSENPTAEQLKTYETAWQAMVAENAPGAAFEKEWRGKEKALVGEQLARVKPRAKAAADEEARVAGYFARLLKLKENEPKQIDPMAEYRTAMPLVNYTEDPFCGFRNPTGHVVVPAQYQFCSVLAEGYGLYKVGVNESWANAPSSACGSSCLVLYDQNGSVVTSIDGKNEMTYNTDLLTLYIRTSESLIQYGLVVVGHLPEYGWSGRYYSVPEGRFLNSYTTGPSEDFVLRHDRPAGAFWDNAAQNSAACGYYPSGDPKPAYRYLYLDTERFEETGICINPSADPLNTKVE